MHGVQPQGSLLMVTMEYKNALQRSSVQSHVTRGSVQDLSAVM